MHTLIKKKSPRVATPEGSGTAHAVWQRCAERSPINDPMQALAAWRLAAAEVRS
jgi:hypothetical protein